MASDQTGGTPVMLITGASTGIGAATARQPGSRVPLPASARSAAADRQAVARIVFTPSKPR